MRSPKAAGEIPPFAFFRTRLEYFMLNEHGIADLAL
jgi:hypothetical protein